MKYKCSHCGGSGIVLTRDPVVEAALLNHPFKQICPTCGGTGWIRERRVS
jgi:DnaJ-class molecular chaperone